MSVFRSKVKAAREGEGGAEAKVNAPVVGLKEAGVLGAGDCPGAKVGGAEGEEGDPRGGKVNSNGFAFAGSVGAGAGAGGVNDSEKPFPEVSSSRCVVGLGRRLANIEGFAKCTLSGGAPAEVRGVGEGALATVRADISA